MQIKQASIDIHNMLSESWFSKKSVSDELLSFLNEASITNILLPYFKDLGHRIGFEKRNVGDNIKKRRFVHPVRKTDDLG